MVSETTVAGYIAFFENLTPSDLGRFEEIFAPDAVFRDPFNEAQGIDAVRRVFEKMFEDVDGHSFKVSDHAVAGDRAYLNWEFTLTPKGKTEVWPIKGMSRIQFRADGKATAHIDFYDAAGQIYEKIPVIGAVLRAMRRRIAV